MIYELDAPLLKIQHEPDTQLVEEKEYEFKCLSNSNPDAYLNSSMIYLAENKKILSINGSLTLKMHKNLNGKTLICQNENSIGKSAINYTLNVHCKLFLYNTLYF